MSFSAEQCRALTAKLDGRAIRERIQAGQTLSYEGPRQGRPMRLYRPSAYPRAGGRDPDLPGRPWQRHGDRINPGRGA